MAISRVKLKCNNCGKEFDKIKSEYDRRISKGIKNFYCTLKCVGLADYKSNPDKFKPFKEMNTKRIKKYCGSRKDQYSPFKYHSNKARSRSKARGEMTDITSEYLKDLWEKQNGICPYTKIKMEISKTSTDKDIKKNPIKASLDRIDPRIGYLQGNVEFVCYCVNVMKNDFTKQEILDFISQIKTH